MYEDLDAVIVEAVKVGHNRFSAILGIVRAVAEAQHPPSLVHRLVDRRLQAMRKKNLLVYKSGGDGWKLP